MRINAKEAAGKKACEFLKNGMTIGIGTGSTARYFIQALGALCREGLDIHAVCTSIESQRLAKQELIPLKNLQELERLDLDIDGADAIDPQKKMIKGGGGALFREKIIATMSDEMIVIVDSSKQVDALGHFPLPVEISPFAFKATLYHLSRLGYCGQLRKTANNDLYKTDNNNYIFDINLNYPCKNPESVEIELLKIPGVIDTGFFIGIAGKVIVGFDDGKTIVLD